MSGELPDFFVHMIDTKYKIGLEFFAEPFSIYLERARILPL